MTGTFNLLKGAFLLLVACSCVASAQDLSNQRHVPYQGLRVEIKTDKSTYAPGEPIPVRVILRNGGTSALYVSKSFFEIAAPGMAGFSLSLKQLTGSPSLAGCGGPLASDSFRLPDSRTAEQVLREDYLYFPPGALVGFETRYSGCAVRNPGTYRVTAVYHVRSDVERVKQIPDKADQIVSGEFRSDPATFRVREVKR